MIGPNNLTALAAFCNTLFYYFEIEKDKEYSVIRLRTAQGICFAFELSRFAQTVDLHSGRISAQRGRRTW